MTHLRYFAIASLLAVGGARGAAVDFNRDIRPLFATHCVACHGGVKTAGGVSFIYRDKALGKGKSGEVVIAPGSPDASELMARITSTDPDKQMPKPGKDRRPLTPAEIDLFRQWISQGAPWSDHWAFVAPTEPPLPTLHNRDWARTTADKFVLAKLEAEGLKPSPAAPPAQWLRRVSLDLIGLPPTPEEYAAFVSDAQTDLATAKERVVDRLLASPRFGERWASMWLDLARYSDTYGFEKDPHRDIWPWRDWVIRAFNQDMPFDQFTIKQLAGDLLAHPSADDLLATGFHRNTQNNTEGGTNDEEWRTAAVIDRVSTTWTTWQATTFGCVQCHSHPYDPFEHEDFYRYMAFFDNCEDCDIDSDFPKLQTPTDPAKREQAAAATLEIAKLREAINAAGRKLAGETAWSPLIPTAAKTTSGALAIAPTGRVTASGTLNFGVIYTLATPAVTGLTAVKIAIYPDSDDPRKWPERGSVLSNLQATLALPDGKREAVALKEVFADFLAGPFDPQETLDRGSGGFGGYPSLGGPRWCVVVLDKPLPDDDDTQDATLEFTLKQGAVADGSAQACPLRKLELSATTDPRWPGLIADPAHKQQWERVAKRRAELARLGGTQSPILRERCDAARRDTRVFIRGNRLAKDISVEPGLPAVMHPPHKSGRLTRLDLATWMVSDQNPLTARVLANRLWAEMYGKGIVETLEDFGTSGARPSNPPLLDHLALRLSHDDHWSIKTFLKEIALSSTYGQDCAANSDLVLRDPQNVLLARGPRVRLTAEMIRDQALLLSGLLSDKRFGPPVFPPQPDGIWRSVYNGQQWKTSTGEDRYRRAIYTYCKRTSGYPTFLTYDAPPRDVCTPRRVVTNTPLQALVSLNDPAFMELAQAMARRMMDPGGGPREIVARGCQMITLQEPPQKMVDTLTRLYGDALETYSNDPALSEKLGSGPESAAAVLVANTLLNTDLALTR